MFFLPLVVLATLLPLAKGQGLDQVVALLQTLPSCSQSCFPPVITSLPCNITSLEVLSTCLCPNLTAQATLSTCVQAQCNLKEQIAIAQQSQALCVGKPIESRSHQLRLITILMASLTFSSIFLRLWSNFTTRGTFWWDDGLIIASMLLLGALVGCHITMANKGYGRHVWDVDISNTPLILKLFWLTEWIYILVQVFAKISITVFYLRVFPQRWFRITCYGIIIWLVSHGLAFLIGAIFQCSPVRSVWDKTILNAHCINQIAYIYAGGAFSISEDIVIILIPMPLIRGLNLSIEKKLNVVVMFGIGIFACITSIVRLKYISSFNHSTDLTWDTMNVSVWSAIEIYIAVICACLPAIRHLLSRLVPRIAGSRVESSLEFSKSHGSRIHDEPLSSHNQKQAHEDHFRVLNDEIPLDERYSVNKNGSSPYYKTYAN